MDIELKKRKLELLRKKRDYKLYNKLEYYSPYPFQVEFHNDTAKHKSLNAGNRPGKTEAGSANMAYHLTGKYPKWWKGTRYTHPILAIAGGKNNEKVRDLAQAALFGDPTNEKSKGTGYVPKSDIGQMIRKPGIPDAKYHVFVKHYTDGVYDGDSKVTFLAYDMGKEAWMGFPADEIWLDEEPPEDIMGQATRAIVDRGGSINQTFTPEQGRTTVVQMIDEHWSKHSATWMDASGSDFTLTLANGRELEFKTVYGVNGQKGHLTEEKVKDALKGMLPHEIEMRVLGEPMQGSGLIFSYPQDQVMCLPIEIPDHWPRIAGMDFGGISKKSHPSAAAWGAYDKENDVIYIYDALKMFSNTPADVASRILGRPQWIQMMYPHDGNKDAPEGGGTVRDLYKSYGVNMYHTHATNFDEEKGEGKGGISREQALIEMNARFADRKLRIFNTLPEVWEEIRNFHTVKTADGKAKIVDREDDLISAIRYLMMMIRFAETEQEVYSYEEEDEWEELVTRCPVTGY